MLRILPSFLSGMQAKANDTTTDARPRSRRSGRSASRMLRSTRHFERNFRIRGGEIDLICRDGKVLVFVEVRQRSRSDFGGAGASITASKRRRIVLAAQHYLAGKPACDCRFDCVLIDGERLEWIRNAFAADD
jgi:putative endonuclease